MGSRSRKMQRAEGLGVGLHEMLPILRDPMVLL